jgi:hypothetical protein
LTDLHDAVGELVRQQVRRVHYLPGDPERHYTARAPCLLAQLQAAVAASSNGGGGRTTPASRLPLAADALDLWVEITANVHGWADLLHIDRRPYRAAERVQFEREERLPGWLRRLWQWTGPAGEMLAPLPVLPPAIHRLAVEDHDPLTDRTVPPVGQLLRAVAARAATLAVDEVTDRIAYKAHSWADRIRTMLGGVQADDHIYPIRGATCPACGATAWPRRATASATRYPPSRSASCPSTVASLTTCGPTGCAWPAAITAGSTTPAKRRSRHLTPHPAKPHDQRAGVKCAQRQVAMRRHRAPVPQTEVRRLRKGRPRRRARAKVLADSTICWLCGHDGATMSTRSYHSATAAAR